MSSSFNQGVLVAIVCEAVLQNRLIKLLITLGVSGYTIVPVQGAGSHGKRIGDMAGYNTNIEVKTIVSPEVSNQPIAGKTSTVSRNLGLSYLPTKEKMLVRLDKTKL